VTGNTTIPSDYADQAAASGTAFSAEAICGSASVIGNIMLWSPYGSGKVLYLDALTWATGTLHDTGYQGADIRNVADLTGYSPFGPGHVTNKNGGAAPKGSLYIKEGGAPNNYPYYLPHNELWTSRVYESKPENFGGVPYAIQQGRGISLNEAFAGQRIATFFWREKDDSLGVVNGPPPPPPPGARSRVRPLAIWSIPPTSATVTRRRPPIVPGKGRSA